MSVPLLSPSSSHFHPKRSRMKFIPNLQPFSGWCHPSHALGILMTPICLRQCLAECMCRQCIHYLTFEQRLKETVKITPVCGPAARPDSVPAVSLLTLLNNVCRLHEAARSQDGASRGRFWTPLLLLMLKDHNYP